VLHRAVPHGVEVVVGGLERPHRDAGAPQATHLLAEPRAEVPARGVGRAQRRPA
jgi:hypothetical protein